MSSGNDGMPSRLSIEDRSSADSALIPERLSDLRDGGPCLRVGVGEFKVGDSSGDQRFGQSHRIAKSSKRITAISPDSSIQCI